MTVINDQIEKFVGAQTEAMKPVLGFYGAFADVAEKMSRQGFAVAGDCVDFAVQQIKLPIEVNGSNEYVGKQLEISRDFGTKMTERFLGFFDIARNAQTQVSEAVTAEVKKAA